MAPLLSLHQIKKSVGAHQLFSNLSFGIFEKEQVALIGRNGAGKSTLLRLIANLDTPDKGSFSYKKNLHMAYVPQEESFDPSSTPLKVILEHLANKCSSEEAEVRAHTHLGLWGFENSKACVAEFSGGWLKKLSLAKALAEEPELLILDEPTNHLDWGSILELENRLKNFNGAFLLISHDRELLQQTTNRTIEISASYPNGFLSFNGNYNDFIERRKELLDAQLKQQQSLANKVRRETEWLNAGVKARTTKSQGRIKEAHHLIEELDTLTKQNRHAQTQVNFSIDSTGRQTKKLLEIQNLDVGYTIPLIKNFNAVFGPKTCIGLLGDNGSGKTTLINTLLGKLAPLAGKIKTADDLKVLYYEQKKAHLPENQNILEFLGEGSDYVTFKERSIHVASYAQKFLFDSEKLTLPISRLSGGERSKLSLAKSLLHPADLLVLDEPTNDLDLESILFLQNILEQFPGLVFIVSHDRKLLSDLCHKILYLPGDTTWALASSLNQISKKEASKTKESKKEVKSNLRKPKLSYQDKKFLENAENIIIEQESLLESKNKSLDQAVQNQNTQTIQELSIEISNLQTEIQSLYDKWSSLEALR